MIHKMNTLDNVRSGKCFFILFTAQTKESINSVLRDWSLIMGRGGLQNWKIAGPKLFAPPPSRQGKTFRVPLFKEWELFAPPLQYG